VNDAREPEGDGQCQRPLVAHVGRTTRVAYNNLSESNRISNNKTCN
jgi:hypothetical protein